MWLYAKAARIFGGMGGIGGTSPGASQTKSGSFRQAASAARARRLVDGNMYQVPGGPPFFSCCLACCTD